MHWKLHYDDNKATHERIMPNKYIPSLKTHSDKARTHSDKARGERKELLWKKRNKFVSEKYDLKNRFVESLTSEHN